MANSKYEKLIAIATAVCVILLGIAFIICTAHLYFTGGDNPYSQESVGKYLMILLVPSIITIVFVIAGLIMRAVGGRKEDELTPRTQSELLESYSSRYDISAFEGEAGRVIAKERKSRSNFAYIAYFFSALIFLLVLAYICFFAKFTVENLNGDVIAALTVALPLSAIALGIHVPRLYLAEASSKRELEAMKNYVKENGTSKIKKTDEPAEKKVNYSLIARYVILAASVVLIVLGITNGGMADVLGKAIRICTECIGLG